MITTNKSFTILASGQTRWIDHRNSSGREARERALELGWPGFAIRLLRAQQGMGGPMRASLMLLVFMLVPIGIEGACAGDAPINSSRMEELFKQDQRDRRGFPDTELSWTEINQRDESRREEVIAALRRGELRTAQDFYIAAVIYHHGQTADHYRLATSLAWIAASMQPDNKTYLWLTASTWDRLMVSREKPQWYGTQPVIDEAGRIVGRYPIDEKAVADAERARFQVMPLEEIRALGNNNWSARIRP